MKILVTSLKTAHVLGPTLKKEMLLNIGRKLSVENVVLSLYSLLHNELNVKIKMKYRKHRILGFGRLPLSTVTFRLKLMGSLGVHRSTLILTM